MIRATTNGVLKGYRMNLNKSFTQANNARNTVLTGRYFNSYAEDPGAASQAFKLRRSFVRTNSQINTCENATRKYQAAWSAMGSVVNYVDNVSDVSAKAADLRGENDPTGSGRAPLGVELIELSESIVQALNGRYGDTFVFAGADGMNVPFTWEEQADGTKELYYRGIPVDTEKPELLKDGAGNIVTFTKAGSALTDPPVDCYITARNVKTVTKAEYDVADALASTDLAEKTPGETLVLKGDDGTEYYVSQADYDAVAAPNDPNEIGSYTKGQLINKSKYDEAKKLTESVLKNAEGTAIVSFKDKDNNDIYVVKNEDFKDITKEEYEDRELKLKQLDYLCDEKLFADIGLGLQENDKTGKLIESSAYNVAISGVKFLGCGVDEDGDPKCIVSIIRRLGEILQNCDDDGYFNKTDKDQLGEDEDSEYTRLLKKFDASAAKIKEEHVDLDSKALFLKNHYAQMETNSDTLNEQIMEIEQVDLADAITAFSWAQYCYNSALKVGNQILSQSLMDYMS